MVGAAPGQSSFYTTLKDFNSTNGTAIDYYQKLQIAPNTNPLYPPYRSGVTVNQFITDTSIAKAKANTQFGAGGLDQIFVPNFQDSLIPLYSIPFKKTPQ